MTLELLWLIAYWGRAVPRNYTRLQQRNKLPGFSGFQTSDQPWAELLTLSLITREKYVPRKCPPARKDMQICR